MSIKRPLSPGSNGGTTYDDTRALKRFKLHAIIQELRNEEANLAMLKKLRACQLSATRTATNNATVTSTNGFHPTATRMPTTSSSSSKISTPLPPTSSSRASLQQPPMPAATRKVPNAATSTSSSSLVTTTSSTNKIPNSTSSNKTSTTSSGSVSTVYSLEERKTQAKVALRKQLERELLNIPSPKPLLQDILFVPNPSSLEFQPYVGLEDVVQCLSELQNDRHRLPQRFTDRAQIDEPFVCDQCGTDFTIRWWKHPTKQQQQQQTADENNSRPNTNILCDRCKKQAVRRTSKSEHSGLLKNVFVSAMEQEKEIEKNFNALIRQHRASSRASAVPSSKSTSNNRTQQSSTVTPTPPPPPPPPALVPPVAAYAHHHTPNNHHNHHNHHPQQQHQHHSTKTKISLPQNFATKLSQQSSAASSATRKSGLIIQPSSLPLQLPPAHTNHFRNLPHTKTSMPVVHHTSHSHYRSAPLSAPSPQVKNQPIGGGKVPKSAIRQPVVSRPAVFPGGSHVPNVPPIIHTTMPTTAATVRPTAAKRRTFPAD